MIKYICFISSRDNNTNRPPKKQHILIAINPRRLHLSNPLFWAGQARWQCFGFRRAEAGAENEKTVFDSVG